MIDQFAHNNEAVNNALRQNSEYLCFKVWDTRAHIKHRVTRRVIRKPTQSKILSKNIYLRHDSFLSKSSFKDNTVS